MRIVIPGGSGQIGQLLARHFYSQGHHVTVLSRGPAPAPWQTVVWDGLTLDEWVTHLEGSDVCINLAGRSVDCRYTAANRRAIYYSRIGTTRLLNNVIRSLTRPPRVWLNASTATIYRHALDRPMDEVTGEIGTGFSVGVAKDWEEAFFAEALPLTRRVALRSGMTFSADHGGVFSVLSTLVRLGLGGPYGPGNQFVSWIHELDFVRAVEFLIAGEELNGPVNLTSPNPLPDREFMHALRAAWNVEIGIPAARWLLEIGTFFLRTESELVLKSRYVLPGRLLDEGFEFEFPDWPAAAEDLVAQWREKFS